MGFPAHPGLTLLVYTAPAESPAADRPSLIASWAVTAERSGELASHEVSRTPGRATR
jgi:hypothetical protein